MNIDQEKTYRSSPSLWPDDENILEDEDDSVIIKLIEQEQYNDIISVRLKEGDNIVEEYEFEILPDEYRVAADEREEELPLLILHYVADFGYYLRASPQGPWGQYEYLIDVAGRFEKRAERTDNPVNDFFFRFLSTQFQMVVLDTAALTAADDQAISLEEIAEESELPDVEMVRNVSGMLELKKLPLSEKTLIPEQFQGLDLTVDITGYEENTPQGVEISTAHDKRRDIIAVIVSLPRSVKYFKFNGSPGGKCSFEFTGRGELPGPFIEDYLSEKLDIEIGNTPRVKPSNTDIELINRSRSLLENVQDTEGLRLPSDELYMEDLILDFVELYLRIQEVVGEARFLDIVDTAFNKRTDELTVDSLHSASVDNFETIGLLLALAIQRLEEEEKRQIEDSMSRKDLDKIDGDTISVDDYVASVGERLSEMNSEFDSL